MAARRTSLPMGSGTAEFREAYKQRWNWTLRDAEGITLFASQENTLDQAIKACYREAKRRGVVTT